MFNIIRWLDTTVAGLIKELTDEKSFRDLINLQQELILGIESDKALPQIEDLISNKFDLIMVIIMYKYKKTFVNNVLLCTGITINMYAIYCKLRIKTKGFGIL